MTDQPSDHNPVSQNHGRSGLIPRVAPCFVSHNMALGGAQTAVLRMIDALPDWVRERTTLYVQKDDMPLLEAAQQKHGFTVGNVTTHPPTDPSAYILSYGNIDGLPQRPTSLLLHSWDDAGWRFISKTYSHMRGLRIAGVSQQVIDRYGDWIDEHDNTTIGVLPPPVSEFTNVKGRAPGASRRGNGAGDRIVVGWMGRPLASKGLFSLPWLLKRDERIVVRAWTGADTAGLEYTRRVQTEALNEMLELADELGVRDRLDLRPLDFDPFAYAHRLDGCHVLLGNSEKEGFLLTAAEALSCGVPVVVTRTCGVADLIRPGYNGELIDWDEDPKRLARAAHRAVLDAARLSSANCLASVAELSTAAGYEERFRPLLAELTDTQLQHEDARVTVGVRIHKGTDTRHLDDAINSVAVQGYKKFKVVLLVDGPWEFGEELAQRYDLPLICTGMESDITHCSWLHRKAIEQCDTEFYKPLDYDDQLLPGYLERAVQHMDEKRLDVYGCKLLTLKDGQIQPRMHWPNKPLESMFTGNSDDNMLPHSSVLLRTEAVLAAGNYQHRAVGLGADDYHLWYRIHQVGGRFFRDDDARHVVYRQHGGNSLPVRRGRYGPDSKTKFIAGATAASLALFAGQTLSQAEAAAKDRNQKLAQVESEKAKSKGKDAVERGNRDDDGNDPPHS